MVKKRFGKFRQERPEGMLRPVFWPQLAKVDSRTPDGRLLMRDGGGTRELPRPFYAQFDNDGHYGAKLAGSLDEVTIEDNGIISGYGWVLDDENGHNLIRYQKAGALRHNSVDLADVEYEIKWGSDDPNDDEFWELEGIDFTKWNIGATTAVGMPAFPDARFELPEVTAAMLTPSMDLLVIEAEPIVFVPLPQEVEMTASAATTVPWADFHIPESDEPHKIVVDRDGRVFGHLCQWDVPHRGYDGQARYAPRPNDSYNEFNHAGPLTEKGPVGTGPIFLFGGHPNTPMRHRSKEQIHEAYGSIENAWCDVRVTEGKFGPWVSGRIRPGLDDATLYAARASHISGHWIGDSLAAIVSVNVPGFLPGAGFSTQHADGVLEMVAGFAPMPEMLKMTPMSVAVQSKPTNDLAPTVTDDHLAVIPSPWNGVEVDGDFEIDFEMEELEAFFAFDDD